MSKLGDDSDPLSREVIQLLQEELPAIEPPPEVKEAILKRILSRTVRSWREWLNRSHQRLDD